MFSKKFWLALWKKIDGKKLSHVLAILAGYGLAAAQAAFPLGIPTGLPWFPFIPWEPFLQILAILGLSVAGGHKVVKWQQSKTKETR